MPKPKRKLTPAQRAARKRRREQTMVIFIHGKQKRVPRPPTIDGLPVEEFIRQNADPMWLHQNECGNICPKTSNQLIPKTSNPWTIRLAKRRTANRIWTSHFES